MDDNFKNLLLQSWVQVRGIILLLQFAFEQFLVSSFLEISSLGLEIEWPP